MHVWSHRIQLALLLLIVWFAGCSSRAPVAPETRPNPERSSTADGSVATSLIQPDRVAANTPPIPPVARDQVHSEGQLVLPATAPSVPHSALEQTQESARVMLTGAPSQPQLGMATMTSPASEPAAYDLLQLTDPRRDGIRGLWLRQDTTIASPGGLAILAIPFDPPSEYRWTVVVERTAGDDAVCLVMPVGAHQTMVVLEGWQKRVSGLNFVSGKWAYDNPTTYREPVFHAGKPTTVVCTVRQSAVSVACDGKTIINWSGLPSELSLDLRYWSEVPAKRFAVTVYDPQTRFRITRMEVVPLGGSAGSSPPALVQQAIPQPPAPGNGGQARPSERSMESVVHGAAPAPTASAIPNSVPPLASGSATEPGLPEAATRRQESVALLEHPLGSGTGFVVGKNLLVTNAHVVDGSFIDEIQVHFSAAGAQRQRPRKVLYEDEVSDLCLLEVDVSPPAIPLLSSHVFRPSEPVVLIGNPSLAGGMMMRNAVSRGTITALMHIDGHDFYQIDANVNPGSSGGPVLSFDGDLIAVVAMKATDEGELEIREALQQLDDAFAARLKQSGQRQKGIAFGVPVSAVGHAVQQVQGQSGALTNQVDARHLAETLFERLSMLGAFHLLELQVNVPSAVRQQARQIELRGLPARSLRIPRNKLKFAELMPAGVADRVARALQSERIRGIIRVYSDRLDERLDQLRQNKTADEAITRQLAELLRLVKQAERSAGHPPADYQRYSQLVLNLNDDIADLLEKTADAIDRSKSASRQ